MKKQLQSFLLLMCLSGMAYGQTGTIGKLDTSITNKWVTTSSSSKYFIADTAMKSNWSRYWMLNVDTKPLMTISDQKPDGSYQVWFDKKAIKHTSDSTFILKRKP